MSLEELPGGGIWVGERMLWFSGVKLRTRMTIVRLSDDQLWIHSASEPTDELCSELDRLGRVSWIVMPNRFHHLHAAAMKERYPDARVIGPASVTAKNERVVLDAQLDDPHVGPPELASVPLRGVPFLDETLFFHARTHTLIGADVMMCGCPADHWTWRWTSRVTGQYLRFKAPPDVRWKTRGGPEVRESIARLAALPIERILVAHSDPVVDRPVEQLEGAWRFVQPR